MSKFRRQLGNRQSQRMFTRRAGSHSKNYRVGPMRGGIRL